MSNRSDRHDSEQMRFNAADAQQKMAYTWNVGDYLDTQVGLLKIEQVLPPGGFGIVYVVYNETHQCRQALKTLKAQWQVDEQVELLKQYLRDEAGRLKELTHLTSDAIVKVRHITEYQIKDQTGLKQTLPFVLMDYIEGESLDTFEGKLSPKQAVGYLRQIAEGLQPIHKVGTFHRDIKPKNIIITPKDQAVLVDFGASRSIREQTNFTKIATAGYAAPEQTRKNGKEGAYTDIYALGQTLKALIHNYPAAAEPQLRLAIEAATAERIGDRPQSIAEWLAMFLEAPVIPVAPVVPVVQSIENEISAAVTQPQSFPQALPSQGNSWLPKILIGLGLMGTLGLATMLIKLPITEPEKSENIISEKPVESIVSPETKPSLKMQTYQDAVQGFQVSYPDNWGLQDAEALDFDGTFRSPIALQLLPPDQILDSDISTFSRIYVEILPNFALPLDDLATQMLADINERFRQSEIFSSKSLKIRSQPAYEVIFSGNIGQEQLKKIQLIKTGGDRQYLITYEALEKNFPIFESEARAILETFEITTTP